MFPCHQEGVWQCEWHDDCTSNFTLQTSGFSVIIRDDQQPNAPNAIEFADPNAKFVAASSGLTVGAKAGIAIGVAVSLLLVALLIFFLFTRLRRQKLANGPTATDHACAHCGHGKVELTGQPMWTEMDAAQTPRWEMDNGRGLDRSGF